MIEKFSYKSWISKFPYMNFLLSVLTTVCMFSIQYDINKYYQVQLALNLDKTDKIVNLPYDIINKMTISYTHASDIFSIIIIIAFIMLVYSIIKKSDKKVINQMALIITIANVFYALSLFNLLCSYDYLFSLVHGIHLQTPLNIHRFFVTDEYINYRNHNITEFVNNLDISKFNGVIKNV